MIIVGCQLLLLMRSAIDDDWNAGTRVAARHQTALHTELHAGQRTNSSLYHVRLLFAKSWTVLPAHRDYFGARFDDFCTLLPTEAGTTA